VCLISQEVILQKIINADHGLQGLMATSGTKGGTQKLPQILLKPTDMTIHWKALEEHFLMVPLVFRFSHFQGKN
jgi:hypothetical protein